MDFFSQTLHVTHTSPAKLTHFAHSAHRRPCSKLMHRALCELPTAEMWSLLARSLAFGIGTDMPASVVGHGSLGRPHEGVPARAPLWPPRSGHTA